MKKSSPVDHYVNFWERYLDFEGKTTVGGYWWVILFNVIISLVLTWVSPYLGGVYGLVSLIPGIAITIRRLHDTNRSGLNVLWALLPVIGTIILIVYLVQKSR